MVGRSPPTHRQRCGNGKVPLQRSLGAAATEPARVRAKRIGDAALTPVAVFLAALVPAETIAVTVTIAVMEARDVDADATIVMAHAGVARAAGDQGEQDEAREQADHGNLLCHAAA